MSPAAWLLLAFLLGFAVCDAHRAMTRQYDAWYQRYLDRRSARKMVRRILSYREGTGS